MAKHTDVTFISGAVPELNAAAVPEREYLALGSCVLALAKALQGDKPGEFGDQDMQAKFELWKADWEARKAARRAKGD